MLDTLIKANDHYDALTYHIKDRHYDELEDLEVIKHNCYHFLNMLAKFSRLANGELNPEEANRLIETELAPDLLIYTLQFVRAFKVTIGATSKNIEQHLYNHNEVIDDRVNPTDNLTELAKKVQYFDKYEFVNGRALSDFSSKELYKYLAHRLTIACSVVGTICDKDDHNTELPIDIIETEVIPAFLGASLRLSTMVGFDLLEAFHKRRLESVKKYAPNHLTTTQEAV